MAIHDNNLTATLALIELCRTLGVPRLVYASSAAVYGQAQKLPLGEDTTVIPLSPYGLQKLAGEHYGRLFAKNNALTFIALRFFNVYGPRQQPDSPYSGVISKFNHAMEHGYPITIYGDGDQTRDFIYVHDVARAIILALTAPFGPGVYHVCNIGTGRQTTIKQLVDLLSEQYPKWPCKVHQAPPRTGDIPHSCAQVTSAIRTLDFIAQWSVSDGMAQM